MDVGNGNGDSRWVQAVLARIEDHMQAMRRFMYGTGKQWEKNEKRWEQNEKKWEQNEKKWEQNEKRWWANHKIVVHLLEEVRRIKMKR